MSKKKNYRTDLGDGFEMCSVASGEVHTLYRNGTFVAKFVDYGNLSSAQQARDYAKNMLAQEAQAEQAEQDKE